MAAILPALLIAGVSAGASALEGAQQAKAMKAAQMSEAQAQQAQERESHAAEEDAQLQAQGTDTATRVARAAGQRVLAFQGDQAGVGTSSGKPGLSDTLGG